MNTKQNIGLGNALFRITCGLTILTWCTAKLVKKPWRQSYLLIAMFGAMRVAEGILRYCPLTDYIKNNNNFNAGQKQENNHKQNSQQSHNQNYDKKEHQQNENSNKPDLKQLIDTFTGLQSEVANDIKNNNSQPNNEANQNNHQSNTSHNNQLKL